MENICDFSDEDFFCKLGLYQKVDIDCNSFINDSHDEYNSQYGMEYNFTVHDIKYSEQFSRLINFMNSADKVYMFCPFCKNKMSFELFPVKLSDELKEFVVESYCEEQIDEEFSTNEKYKMSDRIKKILSENRYFDKVIRCTHDNSHLFKFSFTLEKKGDYPNESLVLLKIGQYPSVADLVIPEIAKYKLVLGKQYHEFSKAIGLFAHGIGIGSFVYLRRIIEKLVFDKYEQFSDKLGVTAEKFEHLKFDDKIAVLKNHLPPVLVTNKNVYGIVSKGIHELSEDECKSMFTSIKIGIELILDDLLAEKERAEKEKLFETFVAQKTGELRQK